MRFHLRAILPALLAVACSAPPAVQPPQEPAPGEGGSGPVDPCPPAVTTEPADCLDFGVVRVGLEKTLSVAVNNPGADPVELRASVDGEAFQVNPGRLAIPAHGASTVDLRFLPTGRGAEDGSLWLDTDLTCLQPTRLCLRGGGVQESLAFEPYRLDFGAHVPGTTTCRSVFVRNTGDVSLHVRDIRLDDGLLHTPRAFALGLGDILNNKEIRPGEAGVFQVCFTPARRGDLSGNLVVHTDEEVRQLPVTGSGASDPLTLSPDRLDLGTVQAGRAITRTISVHVPFDAALESVEPRPADGAITVLTSALPRTGEVELEVTFRGQAGGEFTGAIVLGLHDEAGGTDPLEIPVTARIIDGAPCELSVEPASVSFGLVRAGRDPADVRRREVHLRNAAATSCKVWGFALDPAVAGLSLEGAPPDVAEIGPGEERIVSVVYAPREPGIQPVTSSLDFQQRSLADPEVRVPIGNSLATALCVRVEPAVELGAVPLGHAPVRALHLVNCGTWPILLGGNDPASPPAPGWHGDVAVSGSQDFSLRGVPRLPLSLPGGEELKLDVVYAPASAGRDDAAVEVWPRNAPVPILVELSGEAIDAPCGDLCRAPQATCPGARSVRVGQRLALAGFARDDADGESPPENARLRCAWSVQDAPAGSTAAPDSPTSCASTFVPDAAGDTTLRLDVTDGDGLAASCVTSVHADLYTGLWIETTWSSPADVDLHLFHSEAGDPREPGTWISLPYDCYYSNRAPRWDGLSRIDDPRLERDDEVGTGPESILVDEPSTEHPYEIGVHWFAGEAESEQVTTRIHCGGAIAGTITTTLAKPHQAAWVATVRRLGDGSCTITPHGDLLTVDP